MDKKKKKKKKKRIEASPLALIMIEPLQDSEFLDVFPGRWYSVEEIQSFQCAFACRLLTIEPATTPLSSRLSYMTRYRENTKKIRLFIINVFWWWEIYSTYTTINNLINAG